MQWIGRREAGRTEALAAVGIDRSKLPDIAGSFEVIGNVSAKAARETGLSPKTKVVCGSGDFPASMFTSGLREDGLAVVYLDRNGGDGMLHRQTAAVP